MGKHEDRWQGWRMESHDAAKRYRHGTHRVCFPEETLARLKPLLPAMGITRVANVTGLDRTGIHVVTVCRPNARSISVSQGKGVTLAAAKASGIMEAAEVWHAERILNPLKLASTAEMRAAHRVIDLDGLPRSNGARHNEALPLLWIEGHDLLEQVAVWVPFEAVSANYTLPLPPGTGCFQSNTKGLASGNHALEAIVHGLCEVVERDAKTLWQLRSLASHGGRRLLDLDTVNDPDCTDIIDRFSAAGLRVRVWDVTTDIGIAAFVCTVMGDGEDAADPEFGAGCHPTRNVALLRALTEAGQARNTYISGSRDDYFPKLYTVEQRAAREAFFRCLFALPDMLRPFGEVPTFESESLQDDIEWALERLQSARLKVIAVDLTNEAIGIPVIRVIVPGLAGLLEEGKDDPVLQSRVRRLGMQ